MQNETLRTRHHLPNPIIIFPANQNHRSPPLPGICPAGLNVDVMTPKVLAFVTVAARIRRFVAISGINP